MPDSIYPKISIITPNYNLGQYLEQTILSVINQNYPNLEYIIIDGGSTDNSVNIIKKYEQHITYWVSEPDQGMYHALQKGFDKSTGEIMAWINADDMYYSGAFDVVREVFKKYPRVQWISGFPTCFDEEGRSVNIGSNVKLWSKYNYYLGDFTWIQQESTFWKTILWKKAGGYITKDCKLAGDYDLWLRFFRYEKLYNIAALTGGYRIRKGQLSREHAKNYREEVYRKLQEEKMDRSTKKRLLIIKLVRSILRAISFINLYPLRLYYYKLFEYPPKIIFNKEEQKLEIQEGIDKFDFVLKTQLQL